MAKSFEESSQILFSILADYVNQRSGSYDVDETVLDLARIHNLEAIVCSCTNAEQLQQSQAAQLYFYQNRKALIKKIAAALGDTPFFTVKGIAVSDYYPVPFHRSMGDTDIIIHSQNRDFTDKALLSLGFSRNYSYWFNDMEVEIHNQLIKEGDGESRAVYEFFNDFWPYVEDGLLDWSFHFLFLIVHLKKHLLHSGCGIRQFLDIAVLVKNNDKLDWDWITENAEKLGLLPFLQSCLFLCSKWFEIVLPINVNSLDESTYQYITDTVLHNGVFGHYNKKTNDFNSSARNSNLGLRGKLSRQIRYFFPSYVTMKEITYYSFIEGKPLLLPLAWCYRAARGFKKGKTIIVNNKYSVCEDDLLLHKNMMQQLGIEYK